MLAIIEDTLSLFDLGQLVFRLSWHCTTSNEYLYLHSHLFRSNSFSASHCPSMQCIPKK
jgi:hypothetical protein